MKVKIEFTKEDLKRLIVTAIDNKVVGEFDAHKIKIEVKSAQNYKSEWEDADFRATYEGDVK